MPRGSAVKWFVVSVVLVLAAAACGSPQETETVDDPTAAPGEVSATLGDAPDEVRGNVVEIPVNIEGFEVVKADGDTSGSTGHFHVFIDKDPVEVGEAIPTGQPDIVHSAENPIKLWGMAVGTHEVHIVLGDGTHKRIHEDVDLSFEVNVEGPSVDGKAPATIEEGETLTIELASEGVEIVTGDGDRSGDTGHYHVLVDPAEPPAPNDVIPAAADNKIVHTTEATVEIEDLAKGEHTIWVVLGDGTHTAFAPPVMDKLTVTVM